MKYLLDLVFPVEHQFSLASADEKGSAGQHANSVAAQKPSFVSFPQLAFSEGSPFKAAPQLDILQETIKLALQAQCQRLSKAIVNAETQQQRTLFINALSEAVSQCESMPVTLCLQSTGIQLEGTQLTLPAGKLAEFFRIIGNLNGDALDSATEELKEETIEEESCENTAALIQVHPAFYACIESNEEFLSSLLEQRTSYEARCLCEAERSICMAKQDATWILGKQIRILLDQLLQNTDKSLEHSLGATIFALQKYSRCLIDSM